MPPPAPPPRQSLPLGVAILSVLVGIYGFILFVLGLLLFGSVAVTQSYFHVPSTFGVTGLALAALVTIFGLVILGIGVALWRLRLWALVLGLLFLLWEIFSYAYAGAYATFGFVFAVIIFVYLIAVHRHFR